MEEKKEIESGFRILNILLLESTFNRVETVEFNNSGIQQEIKVEINVNVDSNKVAVTDTIIYKQMFNEIEQVSAVIKMIGLFEKIGDSPLDIDQFGNVNAPAIIFPYIREHLSNLSAKAGLGLIFLPPVNLTKRN